MVPPVVRDRREGGASNGPFEIDFPISNFQSRGTKGDRSNFVAFLGIDTGGVTITGIGWDVTLSAFEPSLLSEISLHIDDFLIPSGIGFDIHPALGDDFSAFGIPYATPLHSTPHTELPSGFVRLEFYETVDDASVHPDGLWGSGMVTLEYYTPCEAPATATFRNAGANPPSLTTTPPILGAPMTVTVDLTTTGHNLAFLAAYAGTLNFVLGNGQVLLHDITHPAGELLGQSIQPGPIATWTIPVPGDVTFCGFFASMQAGHIGGVQPFALSNAQDLVAGL